MFGTNQMKKADFKRENKNRWDCVFI
jgi:hypothetical protein